VDDFARWRNFVLEKLRENHNLHVIGVASDGLEAVQKAEELQPDLILLDIGLPSLNGIEVARQIRKLSPKSKILFVSQESSADIVQGALSTGAQGYVVKSDAGSELLEGVNAVLRGEQFVSGRFSGHDFVEGSYEVASQQFRAKNPFAPLQQNRKITRRHEVEFYPDDAAFVVGFTRFIEAALKARDAVIVVATESHRKSLLQRLQEHGVDVAAAMEQGRFVSLDVAETLSTFMVNDLPDPARCLKIAGDLVMAAAKAAHGEPPRVAVCGECAPSLWAQGKADAAVQIEHLWDEIARTHEVDMLCGYVLNSFQREQESHIYERICAEHSAVSSQ
jgi:DNA-binding NarL/FixJ family response regulator